MIITKRRPPSAGEILEREFLEPLGMTQTELADAMGVQRRLVNEIINERRAVTVQTALLLSKVLGTTAEFWLNMQHANDMWDALNSPEVQKKVEQAKPCRREEAHNHA